MPRSENETFTSWMTARQHALLRTAVLLTGDLQRAEDLVQEALLKVALRWSRLEHQQPEAFARRVMVRDNISWWRRRRRDVVTDSPPESQDAERQVDGERSVMVRAALGRLTSRQRTVLVLRFYSDLSVVETAELMGTSSGTVKSQTAVALQRLREVAPELAELIDEVPP